MCLTIPARVLSTRGNFAMVSDSSQKRQINISALGKIKIGDWVLYAESNALKVISPSSAKEIIELLETAPKVDLAKADDKFKKTLLKQRLNKKDIIYLLESEGPEKEILLSEANVARQIALKDFFCVHGIIEFSNYCRNDCAYCGLKSSNKTLPRYRLLPKEIVKTALEAINKKGYKLLVLQSGEDIFYTDQILIDIIKEIKRQAKVFIFISIGERGYSSYKKLKKAGVDGVLFRFETANPKLFKKLHGQGKNYQRRFQHLRFMKKLGYFIATGSIIGLPEQTLNDLAEDILKISQFANMVTIGPLVLIDKIPDKDRSWKIEMTLKMTAVLRLMMKRSRIPVVTALETLAGPGAKKRGLRSGANSLMINLTPDKYRRLYQIYPNKYHQKETLWEKYGLFQAPESYKMLAARMNEEKK